MHLVIPFASALAEEVRRVLPTLVLPNLARLLARLEPAARDEADAWTLTPPHERALAAAWGWHGGDGRLPFGARAAATDGLVVGDEAWGLVTPAHWLVGRDHVTMLDPAALALEADESRTAFEALRGLFEEDGYAWHWGAPLRWYVTHADLAGLPCASPDRVIGRNVDFWIDAGSRADARAARIRRLQSEVQLLLYSHPLNEAREARGHAAVNSFWLSGCGPAQPVDGAAARLEASLRAPLLAGDVRGWATAWAAIDAGPLAQLVVAASSGAAVALTLCGERAAQRYESRSRSLWQKLRAGRGPEPRAVLEGL
jgi:hypothetical protein